MDYNELTKTFSKDNTNFLDVNGDGGIPSDLLRGIYQLYNSAIMEVRTKLEILDSEFHIRHDHDPIHHIEYRLKSPASILNKLHKHQVEQISPAVIRAKVRDIAGIRVICNYVEDIYRIAELLLFQNDVTLLRRKDYIEHPKPSGYRSLHLLISVPVFLSRKTEYVPVEIQIRTIAMDFWASLEHHLKYKSNLNIPPELKTELFDCASMVADLDLRMQGIQKKIGDYQFPLGR